jgi:DNA-directed RNA polymerase
LDERAQWIDEIWDKISQSISNPFDGDMWWTEAGDPWQFLATALELQRILNSPNPAKCTTGLTVHQDGSCNGLQHYSALTRDAFGGKAVNLVPADKPADVYSTVLHFAKIRIQGDESRGDKLARLLLKYVNRKTVKQTVMTSVYGVTHLGAKDQILKQLIDREDIDWPDTLEKKEVTVHYCFRED